MKRTLSITFFFIAVIFIGVGIALIPLDIDPVDKSVFKGTVHLESFEIGQFYEVLADESVNVREIEQLNDGGHYLVSFVVKAPLDFPYGHITYTGDEVWVFGLSVLLIILAIAAYLYHGFGFFPDEGKPEKWFWWQVDWSAKNV